MQKYRKTYFVLYMVIIFQNKTDYNLAHDASSWRNRWCDCCHVVDWNVIKSAKKQLHPGRMDYCGLNHVRSLVDGVIVMQILMTNLMTEVVLSTDALARLLIYSQWMTWIIYFYSILEHYRIQVEQCAAAGKWDVCW